MSIDAETHKKIVEALILDSMSNIEQLRLEKERSFQLEKFLVEFMKAIFTAFVRPDVTQLRSMLDQAEDTLFTVTGLAPDFLRTHWRQGIRPALEMMAASSAIGRGNPEPNDESSSAASTWKLQ